MVFFGLFCLGFSAFAQAQDSSQPSSQSSVSQSGQQAAQGTSTAKRKAPRKQAKQDPLLKFDLAAISYSSPSPVDDGLLQQFQVELDYKKKGEFSAGANVILGSFSTPHSLYYALPEGYISYGDKFTSFNLGRKIENLSQADTNFNLGLMQGFTTNDFINFTQNGLVTLSAHYNTGSNTGFYVGYSPMFIPNQGPSVKAEDGKIVSSNRWATSPPKEFKFGDQNREIIYAIRDFKLSDIVFNSGLIANFYVGEKRERPTFMATYAQKPINELALMRDTYADISTVQGNVLLTPVVLTHEVYSADLNLDSGMLKTTFSYIADQPVNKTAPDPETIQTLSPLSVAAVYVGLDLSEMLDRKLEIYAMAADISGGEIRDLNSQGQSGSFSFATSRTQFKKPIRSGIKGEMATIFNRPLKADLSLTYDQQLKGSLLSTKINYAASNSLSFTLAADIIGVENENVDGTQSNYLDQNQGNDRVSAGVGYAF